jgi:hypothetical protein
MLRGGAWILVGEGLYSYAGAKRSSSPNAVSGMGPELFLYQSSIIFFCFFLVAFSCARCICACAMRRRSCRRSLVAGLPWVNRAHRAYKRRSKPSAQRSKRCNRVGLWGEDVDVCLGDKSANGTRVIRGGIIYI